MDAPLHAASVLANAAGLRAHRAILWDFYPGNAITLGVADHAGAPKPLQRAYALLARMIPPEGAVRIGGQWIPGEGVALATRDASGKVRTLFVNRTAKKRKAKLEIDGKKRLPSAVLVFDDPAAGIVSVEPRKSIRLPARSLVLVEF
jgi:hypothetical protein